MQIQQLYRDVREHRDLFVRVPFRRVFKHREYRQAFFYALFLFALLVSLPGWGEIEYLYDHWGLVLLAIVPFLLMAIRCHDIIASARAKAVEAATNIERRFDCGLSISVGLQEQLWFQIRYGCDADQLVSMAIEKERYWSEWQRISTKVGDNGGNELFGFFFSMPERGRFMTLIAAWLAIIGTLIITYGGDREVYFELLALVLENIGAILIVITLLCVYLGLVSFFIKDMLRGLDSTLLDRLDSSGASERSVYRFLRNMMWAGGVTPVFPERENGALGFVERVVELSYMPLGGLIRIAWRGASRWTRRVLFLSGQRLH